MMQPAADEAGKVRVELYCQDTGLAASNRGQFTGALELLAG